MVVVFSGGGTAGHLYPAMAIAGALVEELPRAEPFFVGSEGRIEADELPKLGHPYRLVRVRGLRRPLREARRAAGAGAKPGTKAARFLAALAGNAMAIWLLAAAVARLVPEFRRRGARAVVLTGGYVAAPAGIAGRLTGLPVVVQEQNMHPGVVTRLTSRWAAEVHLAYPEAKAALPRRARSRVRESGNPIRPLPPTAERDQKAARVALGVPVNAAVVLMVGGSQGARALNRATAEALRQELPGDREFVLWVAGRNGHRRAVATLEEHGVQRARAVPYLRPREMYRALAAADLAVSRAGAMATSEFLAWGLPSVLVPLPTAAEDHQTRNALALEAAGAAVHVPENDPAEGPLTGRRLWTQVRRLLAPDSDVLTRMSEAARRRARPEAAREIAAAVARLVAPAPAVAPAAPESARRGAPGGYDAPAEAEKPT